MDIFSLIGAVSTARPISIHVVIDIPLPGKRNDINYLFSKAKNIFFVIEEAKIIYKLLRCGFLLKNFVMMLKNFVYIYSILIAFIEN